MANAFAPGLTLVRISAAHGVSYLKRAAFTEPKVLMGKDQTMQKPAGILLSLGAVLFLIAVFTPLIPPGFFSTEDRQLQADLIAKDPGGWAVAHTLLGAGSVLAALGVLLFARQIQSMSDSRTIKIASYLGAAMALIGAIFWVIICYNRVAMDPQALVRNINVVPWLFSSYTVLTDLALMSGGVVLLQAGYPKWLGWLVLVLGGLILVIYLVSGDIPPLFHYLVFLILGIALLLMRARSSRPISQPARTHGVNLT
jgi:hypothetical protein